MIVHVGYSDVCKCLRRSCDGAEADMVDGGEGLGMLSWGFPIRSGLGHHDSIVLRNGANGHFNEEGHEGL